MLSRYVGRAVTLAVLITVAAAAPVVRAAEEGTGSSSPSTADTAKGKMPSSPADMMKMKPHELFNMMDKDKNGYVTKEQFLKFQEQLFNTWDKDKTGRLEAPVFTDHG
jgi:hypothetical protein